ncbi:hypothetical protein NpNSSI1_00011730 [Neofusicoccum parvum]|nr:hypothetical protein NpNSSI1_00011730 [Neofusicoccum parvum]
MASKAITTSVAPETHAAANARAARIIADHQRGRKFQTVKNGATGVQTTATKQVQHKHLPTQEELDRWVQNLNGRGNWADPAEKFWASKNLRLGDDKLSVVWVSHSKEKGASQSKEQGLVVPAELWGAKIRDAHVESDGKGSFVHHGRDATVKRCKEVIPETNLARYKAPQKEIIMAFIMGCPQCVQGGKKREARASPSDHHDDDEAAAAPRPAKRSRLSARTPALRSSSSPASASASASPLPSFAAPGPSTLPPCPFVRMEDLLLQHNVDPALVSSPPTSLTSSGQEAEHQQQQQRHHQGPDMAQPQVSSPLPFLYQDGPNMAANFGEDQVWYPAGHQQQQQGQQTIWPDQSPAQEQEHEPFPAVSEGYFFAQQEQQQQQDEGEESASFTSEAVFPTQQQEEQGAATGPATYPMPTDLWEIDVFNKLTTLGDNN